MDAEQIATLKIGAYALPLTLVVIAAVFFKLRDARKSDLDHAKDHLEAALNRKRSEEEQTPLEGDYAQAFREMESLKRDGQCLFCSAPALVPLPQVGGSYTFRWFPWVERLFGTPDHLAVTGGEGGPAVCARHARRARQFGEAFIARQRALNSEFREKQEAQVYRYNAKGLEDEVRREEERLERGV